MGLLTDDIINVQELIDRHEELEDILDSDETLDVDDLEEYNLLSEILDDLKGYGSDLQYRGSWYPSILIAEYHFTDYIFDLLEDMGEIPRDLPSSIVIDREATAENYKMDYSSTEINGETYYFHES